MITILRRWLLPRIHRWSLGIAAEKLRNAGVANADQLAGEYLHLERDGFDLLLAYMDRIIAQRNPSQAVSLAGEEWTKLESALIRIGDRAPLRTIAEAKARGLSPLDVALFAIRFKAAISEGSTLPRPVSPAPVAPADPAPTETTEDIQDFIPGGAADDAVATLVVMGVSKSEAKRLIAGVLRPDATVEELVKLALKARA